MVDGGGLWCLPMLRECVPITPPPAPPFVNVAFLLLSRCIACLVVSCPVFDRFHRSLYGSAVVLWCMFIIGFPLLSDARFRDSLFCRIDSSRVDDRSIDTAG